MSGNCGAGTAGAGPSRGRREEAQEVELPGRQGDLHTADGDPAVGPVYEMEIWKVKIKPTGDIPWITDEWGQIEFEFEVL